MPATDIALVFPPLWYYLHAPPELTSLTALLRAGGWAVSAVDGNREAMDDALSAERLPEGPGARAEAAKRTLRGPGFFDLAAHAEAVSTLRAAWDAVGRAHDCEIDFLRFRGSHDTQTLDGCLAAARDEHRNPFLRWARGLVSRLNSQGVGCVGLFYVHPEQIVPLVTAAVLLRESGFRGPILVLGSLEDQVTFARFLRNPGHPDWVRLAEWIDGVIVGDAEPTLPVVLTELRASGRLPRAPNLVHLTGARDLPTPALPDLDTLPVPDCSDLPLDRYLYPEPVLALVASRGCYWNRCTFCAITSNHPNPRARSPERVADDLATLHRSRGIRWFQFRDMLFAPSWALRLCHAIRDRGLDIAWTCRARFERAWTRSALRAMADAGCRQMWLGLESAHPRVLAEMDKGTDPADIDRMLVDLESVGIGAHLLVLHGHPGETDPEAEHTADWVVARRERIDTVSYTNFVLFSHTPIFQRGEPRAMETGGLFQYRFEYLPREERRRVDARYQALRKRIEEALPMPLWHPTCSALYRERLGAHSWRRGA